MILLKERLDYVRKYTLKYKDISVGILSYDTESRRFSYETINKTLDKFKYPPILFDYRYFDVNHIPTNEEIIEFLEERTIPECRADKVLEMLGMDNYNVWEICKATRGVVADDYWWLAKDGDRYEDFHIRARFEKNN